MKILNSSKCNGEEFINEVGTMGRINHVNVVHPVDTSMKVVVQMLGGEGDKLTTPPKFLIHLLL
ncbi:hypothetical protein CFP56_018076 [Quercus suber]|uniref:Uncharacterized protein n=1 Tax=Quercus suber TaxID=58331 RepID=A0AAW0KIW6_QUESU